MGGLPSAGGVHVSVTEAEAETVPARLLGGPGISTSVVCVCVGGGGCSGKGF